MQNFKNLIVWKKSHELALNIYKETRTFPRQELYGLTSQLRRASTSIPTNLAEGCGRFSQKEFAYFVQNGLGSCQEVEYLSFLCLELDYLSVAQHEQLQLQINEVKAMPIGLLNKVRNEL
jgi:four helix bundle protein